MSDKVYLNLIPDIREEVKERGSRHHREAVLKFIRSRFKPGPQAGGSHDLTSGV